MEVSKENSLKDEIISLIKNLPEDITLDDIMYHLYVKQRILRAKEQIKEDKSYSHEQVKEMAERWLK